jgi:peptide subunit release factor 1 (eRF1)
MQSREPHVVVVVDHAGADIAVFDRHSGGHVETVGGGDHSDPELHNTKPGGWSQARYQRRTKGRWRANAGEAAQRLTQIVNELRPRVIGVAGDVRSVQMFVEQLPPTVREQVREIAGTRARDGSDEQHEDEVARLIRTVVAEDTVMLANKLAEELGQADRGVAGAGATLAALCEARVDTLLVHDDRSDERTAWVSHDLGLVSMQPDDLRALGATDLRQARLVDAAVRAALATGAAVRVVPRLAALAEGIGGTLRH